MAALVLMPLLFICMDTVELFSPPQIIVRPAVVVEGDHMTITCDTEPRRGSTWLQFAFYRNGTNVQGFSSFNQYGVPSAQLEDSGNYTCEVQTLLGRRRRSNGITIQVQGDRGQENSMRDVEQSGTSPGGTQRGILQNTVRLVLAAVIFIIILCFLFYHIKTVAIGRIMDPQAPLPSKLNATLNLPRTLHQHFASPAAFPPLQLGPKALLPLAPVNKVQGGPGGWVHRIWT
ncbi:Fc receptor-like A [Xenopus tropicalis]|uniref:Fc receptor-like A n=1 Tax=Xenopus tropicalis TaxID=8364 RepID=A0A8J1IUU7_XENTR|nr:Fc receptor-like A [Xenopus tropicalis]